MQWWDNSLTESVDEWTNKTKRKKNFPTFFKDNENIIHDKNVITNKFNTYFANIGLSLSEKINMPQNKTFHHYLTHNHNKNTFNFQNINEEHTVSIIDKFAPKSSFGFDGISTKLIKTIKVSLIRPLTLIINQMLNTGILLIHTKKRWIFIY